MKNSRLLWMFAMIPVMGLVSGCLAKRPPESALLIQGRSVAAWVADVEIGLSLDRASDVLVSAGPRIMPDLARLLGNAPTSDKAKAAWVMSIIGYRNPGAIEVKSSVPPLITTLQNDDPEVRIYCAQALGAIGPAASNAIPALILRTKDENASMRMCAVEALGRIGITSPKALVALKVAVSDASSDVRFTAKQALELVQRTDR